MPRLIPVLMLAALTAAAPLSAQNNDVIRDHYTFIGTELSIEISTDLPGRLRVMQGGIGMVSVTARAPNGSAVTSLGGQDDNTLQLTTLGGDRLEAVVSVPARVWVRIHLPGSSSPVVFSGLQQTQTYHWGSAAERQGQRSIVPPPTAPDGRYTLDTGIAAPPEVAVSGATHLESVSVHLGSPHYRVVADRPLSLTHGNVGLRLHVDPTDGRPGQVVIDVPRGTRSFTLRLDEAPALVVARGQVQRICGNVVDQWLSNDRRWITFSPPTARPGCAGPLSTDSAAAAGPAAPRP